MEVGKWSLTTLLHYLERGRQSQKCIYLTQFGQFSLGEEVWYPECIKKNLVRIWLANPQTNLIIDCWRNEHTTVVIDAFNCHHLKVHMHMSVLHVALDSLTHTHTHTHTHVPVQERESRWRCRESPSWHSALCSSRTSLVPQEDRSERWGALLPRTAPDLCTLLAPVNTQSYIVIWTLQRWVQSTCTCRLHCRRDIAVYCIYVWWFIKTPTSQRLCVCVWKQQLPMLQNWRYIHVDISCTRAPSDSSLLY